MDDFVVGGSASSDLPTYGLELKRCVKESVAEFKQQPTVYRILQDAREQATDEDVNTDRWTANVRRQLVDFKSFSAVFVGRKALVMRPSSPSL